MRRLTALTAAVCLGAVAPAALAQSGKKTLASDGRFHQVHSKKLEMACGTCHKKEQTDVLFLRKDEPPAPGAVDRAVCLSCHKDPRQPAWYK